MYQEIANYRNRKGHGMLTKILARGSQSKSSEIEVKRTESVGLNLIEFGNRMGSNAALCVSSIYESIEFNQTNQTHPLDHVRFQEFGSECIRTQTQTSRLVDCI